MTSMIAMTRSLLQALISLADDQVVAIIYKRRGASGRPQQRQLLRVIDLIVDGHGEEIRGLKVMNLHSTLFLTMQLPILFHRFRCVLY